MLLLKITKKRPRLDSVSSPQMLTMKVMGLTIPSKTELEVPQRRKQTVADNLGMLPMQQVIAEIGKTASKKALKDAGSSGSSGSTLWIKHSTF